MSNNDKEWNMSHLFVDETVLVVDSEERLRQLLEFGKVCKRRKLRANESKSNLL